MALVECQECGAERSTSASACPQCGARKTLYETFNKNPYFVIAFFSTILTVVLVYFSLEAIDIAYIDCEIENTWPYDDSDCNNNASVQDAEEQSSFVFSTGVIISAVFWIIGWLVNGQPTTEILREPQSKEEKIVKGKTETTNPKIKKKGSISLVFIIICWFILFRIVTNMIIGAVLGFNAGIGADTYNESVTLAEEAVLSFFEEWGLLWSIFQIVIFGILIYKQVLPGAK